MKGLRIAVILYLTLLVSCKTFYSSNVDMSKITNKISYKSFNQLNDPIVVNMPVYETSYLWGKKGNKSRQKRIGDMFVIVDWEKDTVYDWVFYGKENQYSLPNVLQMGSNPKYYINSLDATGTVAKLDPSKTSVTLFKTNKSGTFYNNSSLGNYCIRDYSEYSEELQKEQFCLNIFDCLRGCYTNADIKIPTDAYGYIMTLNADIKGNFYFSYLLDNYVWLCKVNSKTGMYETNKTIIKSKLDENDDYKFVFDIKYIKDEDFILAFKGTLGNGPYTENKLCLASMRNKELKEFDLDINGYNWLYRIVCIDGLYYAIINDLSKDNNSVDVYELDIENLCGKKISDDDTILIYYIQELMTRGNRIYFFNYLDRHNIQYRYFDVKTKEVGELRVLHQNEIVGFDF